MRTDVPADGPEQLDTHWLSMPEPRVSPGTARELGLRATVVVSLIRLATRGRAVNVFATMGRNRRLVGPWLRFAAHLMPFGRLSRADTELVILRVAYNCRAHYEWVQHHRLARRAGLDNEAIERIKLGPEATGWTRRQSTLLLATDELHRDRMISDACWEELERQLDVPRLIEFCVLVGHYEMLAMTLNSLGVQVEDAAMPRA